MNDDARRRPYALTALLLVAACVFVALGVWQVHRLAWKEGLIAAVNSRIHARPQPLPATSRLGDTKAMEYRRIRLHGSWIPGGTELVRAATDLGTGYWAMTPMRLNDGRTIYVNRGFVADGTRRGAAVLQVPAGPVDVVGLLRMTEPGGSFLQSNRPAAHRWYSRDVRAMAADDRIGPVVPVFVDAQGPMPPQGHAPVPGLTVVSFPNNHLSYLLTWFALAVLSLVGIGVIWRRRDVWPD